MRTMYETMKNSLHFPHIENYAYQTVHECSSCCKQRGNLKNQRLLKLFRVTGLLEFFAIYILRPLLKTKLGNRNTILITDRYRKLTCKILVSTITANYVALTLSNDWIVPYGIPTSLLSYNGPKFASKFFAAVFFILLDLRTTTAYNLQYNRQTEHYNKKIFTRMRHYVNKHQ